MRNKEIQAAVDAIFGKKAFGNVAGRLLSNGMNANALRTNATLLKDEWKELDEIVVQISRDRLVGVNDLVSRGLVHNLKNGLGTTVLETQNASDMEEAQVDMAGVAEGKGDREEFDIGYLPLPIVHKDFQLNIRVLEASRKRGESLDTTQAAIAARKVAEKTEEILFTGASTYKFGGGIIYGYVDHPSAKSVTLDNNWDDSPSNGASILADVLDMKQASINAKKTGPWLLYVPTNYEVILDDDFKANSDLTIRQRIKQIEGIQEVKVADKLTADTVVLVELSPETVRMVIGLQPTTVEWETKGGMVFHFKVMSIMVPQIRADQDGNCGIVVLS